MKREQMEEGWQGLATEALSGMSEWRQAHPRATLADIEAETDRRLAALRARMIEDAAQASQATDLGPESARPLCPQCKCAMVKNGKRRRCLTTRHEQTVTLERQYLVCPQCGAGFFPPG